MDQHAEMVVEIQIIYRIQMDQIQTSNQEKIHHLVLHEPS